MLGLDVAAGEGGLPDVEAVLVHVVVTIKVRDFTAGGEPSLDRQWAGVRCPSSTVIRVYVHCKAMKCLTVLQVGWRPTAPAQSSPSMSEAARRNAWEDRPQMLNLSAVRRGRRDVGTNSPEHRPEGVEGLMWS